MEKGTRQEINILIRDFCVAWRKKDAERFFEVTTKTWKSMHDAKETFEMLGQFHLEDWEIIDVRHITPVVADAVVQVRDAKTIKTIVCRVVKEANAFKTGNDRAGVWGVNPVSALKNLY